MSTTISCDFCDNKLNEDQDWKTPLEDKWYRLTISLQGTLHKSLVKDICPSCLEKLHLYEIKTDDSLESVLRDWVAEEVEATVVDR